MEIFNYGNDCSLDGLVVVYKNKAIPLQGLMPGRSYLAIQDPNLVLTKNPTSSNSIAIEASDGMMITEASYPHGQKQGVSYAIIDGQWVFTYARTPGAKNIYQEYQTCPEGKVINEATGNCVNEETESTTTCPEGKYLNPETGRCKKIEEENELAECAEGYERNPETNRCRKIQSGDGSEYAPRTSASASYEEPRRFIAYGTLAVVVLAGAIYIVVQYREELMRGMRTIAGKVKRFFGKFGTKRRLALLDKI